MKDLRARGLVMAFSTYFIFGIVFIVSALLSESGMNSYAIGAAFFWGTSIGILAYSRIGTKSIMQVTRQNMYVVFMALFIIFVELYWNKPELLYVVFVVEWVIAISFLSKFEIHLTSSMQIFGILVLTFIPEGISKFVPYSGGSAVMVIFGVIVSDWIATNVVKSIIGVYEDDMEHRRSIGDMLDIVEVKHNDAKDATNAKSQFLSNMSHEIRTPINSILGMNEMILRESGEDHILEYAQNVKSASELLLTLINDVLDISKIEAGKMELVPVDFKLTNIINDLNNMVSLKATEKGLIFTIDCDDNLPVGYHGDDVRIEQILVNILNNAIKYTPEGGVKMTVKGDVVDNQAVLDFRVKDTGMGIKPEDIKRLNQKFVRFNEEQNRFIEGSGLGITIINGFLDLMDSHLEVESEFGKGSVFGFSLRLPVTDQTPIKDYNNSPKKTEHKIENDVLKCPNVELLVVDDNIMNLKVFTGLLKQTEAKIDAVESGAKAIELSKVKKYDIIFMDHMMPEMDGIECLNLMRDIPDFVNMDTPVVALTANSVAGAREMYLENGFEDFISKPVKYDALEKKIRDLIGDKR